jgi:hypothetical protein
MLVCRRVVQAEAQHNGPKCLSKAFWPREGKRSDEQEGEREKWNAKSVGPGPTGEQRRSAPANFLSWIPERSSGMPFAVGRPVSNAAVPMQQTAVLSRIHLCEMTRQRPNKKAQGPDTLNRQSDYVFGKRGGHLPEVE